MVQNEVFELIAARGYAAGLEPAQIAARQVAKLTEELGELAVYFSLYPSETPNARWVNALDEIGIYAGDSFDQAERWRDTDVLDAEYAWRELADVQVVVLTMAAALCRVMGEERDIVQEAAEKARADVGRGVRRK